MEIVEIGSEVDLGFKYGLEVFKVCDFEVLFYFCEFLVVFKIRVVIFNFLDLF